MSDVICTTGELKENYQVIGVANIYHSSLLNKQKFGEDIPHDEIFDKLLEEIQTRAEKHGASAVIGIRFEYQFMQAGYLAITYYWMYGTMVKII